MRATKDSILNYLKEIKLELLKDGIISLALFGSFAKGSETVYSDIDIAISKDKNFLENNSSYDYFDILSKTKLKIKQEFHRNIDIFDLDSSTPLKKHIKQELIYV